MKHTWQLVSAVAALVLVGGAPLARADEATVVIPAPPSEARAVALQVEDVLTIGGTGARSGREGGQADANALGLGGDTLVEGQTGGALDGPGSERGALLELQEGAARNGDTDVEVTPYQLDVTEGSASSEAALARLFLADIASVAVLASDSHTSYTEGRSTGTAISDGVRACLGGRCEGGSGIEVVVLHSETSTTGEGDSYVLRVDDLKVLDNDDIEIGDDVCGLTIGDEQEASLVSLAALCVSASGGEGSGAGVEKVESAASVAETSALDLISATALGTKTAGATVDAPTDEAPAGTSPPTVPPVAEAPGPGVDAGRGSERPAVLPATRSGNLPGNLPRTGGVTGDAMLLSGALLGLGLGLRCLGRRAGLA